MTQTGGAVRHGPAPNRCEGNPKARSGAASPQGFTVRCFWVAARDWRRRVHRLTKGGFANSCRKSARPRTRQPWSLVSPAPDLPRGACARLPHRHRPPCPAGTSERCAPTPAPFTNAASAPGTGPAPVSAPEVRAAAHRSGPSAPGPRETLRDKVVTGVNATHRDGGQSPPIGIGPEPLDHHATPRQQPDQCRPRGLARAIIATQA